MPLSRKDKYKTRKNQKRVFNPRLNATNITIKRILLFVGLSIALFASTSIAFADTGLNQYLQKWYFEKLKSVEENLTNSVMTETENQKAQLLRQVREQTENSIKELHEYALKQEMEINQKVVEKMEEASKVIEEENQVDLQLSKDLINQQAKDEKAILENNTPEPTIEVKDNKQP
ncbi:hypothetical protein V7111_03740 [Neobacillus niacini]|uniref:hypothetical protein n=1 Tax=Neobacillus niacini TaxID=86668 RepID=UPI0030004F17